MTKPKIAMLWAAAMILAALAQRAGLIAEGAGDGLFLILLVAAVTNIGFAKPCEACA